MYAGHHADVVCRSALSDGGREHLRLVLRHAIQRPVTAQRIIVVAQVLYLHFLAAAEAPAREDDPLRVNYVLRAVRAACFHSEHTALFFIV